MDDFDARTGAPSETASRGVLKRGLVVEELRLYYLPVSKAACTSLRWVISDLIGLPPETFDDPTKFRATEGQTIQNVHKWPQEYIAQRADPDWLEEVAGDDSWFRFTVVRDPARRLWSAWQSKLLLRQPGYAGPFGDEPWFPAVPSTPEEVLESYERFVAALGHKDEDRRPYDPHWGLQMDQLGDAGPALNHVGRVEAMGETLRLLSEHVARFGKELPAMRRENLSPLPYPEGMLDGETVGTIRDYYAPDYRAFDYAEPEAGTASEEQARAWKERTRLLLPATQVVISRNERLATLDGSLREARQVAAKARKNNQSLRQDLKKRDNKISQLQEETSRLRGRAKFFREELQAERRRLRSADEALRAMQRSSVWRLTAPLRRLISAAKRAGRRG